MSPQPVPQAISRSQAWLLAIRPKTLPAAVGPVIVGTALAVAGGAFALLPALAALACALLLQVASNLANDYFDFVRGLEQPDRTGPTRVAQSGLISLPELRLGLALVLVLTALIGLYLIAAGGWPILIAGAAAMLAAVAYSAGPFPLASHGLGDLFVFVFFGLVAVAGTYYVQAQSLSPQVVLAAVPSGALITAILVVNNLRDIEVDGRVGKRTLAVRLGVRGALVEYWLLLVLAYAVPVLLWLASGWSPWILVSWLSLPLALRLARAIQTTPRGPALNQVLAGTARLGLLFAFLFAVGIVL